jgi:hypothetical protein
METSNADVQSELIRRHKATVKTVLSLVVGVVLLCVLAYVSQKVLTRRDNPSLDMALNIAIVIFGFGAIALRRTKFAKMRLQDIAALQGTSGLLITLQRTTLQVEMIGILIAIIGFGATLMTGTAFYTFKAGVVAVAVLLYGYPVRVSWEQAVRRYSPTANEDPAVNPS